MASELACGIAKMHSLKIVHCDIKLGNLLIDPNGHLRIIDFSCSVIQKKLQDPITGYNYTEGYKAPEITNTGSYNYKVDWYSYGIVLWHLFGLNFNDLKVFPKFFDERAECINTEGIELFLHCTAENPDERINGISEIQKYPYFDSIDWKNVRNQCNEPPGNIFSIFFICRKLSYSYPRFKQVHL